MELFFTKLMCFIVPLVCLCDVTSGIAIEYKNCGPNTVKGVDLAPCTEAPCVFHRGQNVTVTIDFNTTQEVATVNTEVYGIVANIPVRFHLPTEDGCDNAHLTCPLASGGDFTYWNTLPVLDLYPTIKLYVKWKLVDADENDLVCFIFPMSITDA